MWKHYYVLSTRRRPYRAGAFSTIVKTDGSFAALSLMLNVDDVVFNDFGPTWTFLQLTRFFLLHVAFIIFCVSRAAQSAVCHSLHGRNVKTPPLSCHNSLQANFIITLELWIVKLSWLTPNLAASCGTRTPGHPLARVVWSTGGFSCTILTLFIICI